MVACLCTCAQMVIGLLTVTGLGIKVSEVVVSLSGGNVLACLFFTMIVAIILGMGVPTTAAYVLGASVCVPPLTKLGIAPFVAHMFVFYFAIISAITPPVCAAVYVAAAIAKSDWLKTGFLACKLGLAGFIVPFMFFYTPSLLLRGTLGEIILNSATAYLGIFALSAATIGFLRRPLSLFEQLILYVSAFLLVGINIYGDVAGSIILGFMYFSQYFGFSLRSLSKGLRGTQS